MNDAKGKLDLTWLGIHTVKLVASTLLSQDLHSGFKVRTKARSEGLQYLCGSLVSTRSLEGRQAPGMDNRIGPCPGCPLIALRRIRRPVDGDLFGLHWCWDTPLPQGRHQLSDKPVYGRPQSLALPICVVEQPARVKELGCAVLSLAGVSQHGILPGISFGPRRVFVYRRTGNSGQ